MIKQQKKLLKRKKKVYTLPAKSFFLHVFWAYGSRGNPRKFFLMDFKGTNQLPVFFGDFHLDILLIVLMICQKMFGNFFGVTGHEPKIDVRFDFVVLIFDFGVLILGVWILEF